MCHSFHCKIPPYFRLLGYETPETQKRVQPRKTGLCDCNLGHSIWNLFGAWASFAGVDDGVCVAMGILSIISAIGSIVFNGHLLYGSRQKNPKLISIWIYGQIPMVLLSLVEIYLATALLVRGHIYIPNNRSGIIVTGFYVGGHAIYLALTAVFLLVVVPFWNRMKRTKKLLGDC